MLPNKSLKVTPKWTRIEQSAFEGRSSSYLGSKVYSRLLYPRRWVKREVNGMKDSSQCTVCTVSNQCPPYLNSKLNSTWLVTRPTSLAVRGQYHPNGVNWTVNTHIVHSMVSSLSTTLRICTNHLTFIFYFGFELNFAHWNYGLLYGTNVVYTKLLVANATESNGRSEFIHSNHIGGGDNKHFTLSNDYFRKTNKLLS